MSKKILILTFLLAGIISQSMAQFSGDYDYTREFIWGIKKATHSGLIGGIVFKRNILAKPNVYHGWGIEVVNINHPKEYRQDLGQGSSYKIGKENYLYNIRGHYNREYRIFRKAAQQGVQVNAVFAGGLSIGLESPYYVEVDEGGTIKQIPYDHTKNIPQIRGSGTIFAGLFESKIVPGGHVKAALAFEFGAFKSNVMGLEAGFMIDIFSREIMMIPTTYNKSVFPAAFVTLYYGNRK